MKLLKELTVFFPNSWSGDIFKDYELFITGTKKDLIVEHLLTMSSGLQRNEDILNQNTANTEMLNTV